MASRWTPGPVMQGFATRALTLSWSPHSQRLAFGGGDGFVTIWDSEDGALLEECELGLVDIDSLAWSSDGSRLAAGSESSWALFSADGEKYSVQGGHVGTVMALAFAPNDELIATAGWDHTIRLWSSDGTPKKNLKGHTAQPAGFPGHPTALDWPRPVTMERSMCGTLKPECLEWSAYHVGNDEMVTVSAAGQLLSGEHDTVEEELNYLVEKPNGAMEVLTYSEFLERISPSGDGSSPE